MSIWRIARESRRTAENPVKNPRYKDFWIKRASGGFSRNRNYYDLWMGANMNVFLLSTFYAETEDDIVRRGRELADEYLKRQDQETKTWYL